VIILLQRPLSDNTQQTNIHAPGGNRAHYHSRQAAIDLCLRPHGHWDWHTNALVPRILHIIHIAVLEKH
jgi:hypothetical protein